MLMLAATVGLCQTYTNGVYVKGGKTFEVDRKVHQITPTNTTEILHFSNELIVKVHSGGDFTINSFFQEVLNADAPAAKAKFGVHNLAATLMTGKAIVSCSNTNENSSCVISTPMFDVALHSGLFYLEVTEKKVIVACLDGSFQSFSGKKELLSKAGQAIIAEPNDVGILEDKVAVSPGKVNVSAMKQLTIEAKEVQKMKETVLFSTVNGKLVGIVLN